MGEGVAAPPLLLQDAPHQPVRGGVAGSDRQGASSALGGFQAPLLAERARVHQAALHEELHIAFGGHRRCGRPYTVSSGLAAHPRGPSSTARSKAGAARDYHPPAARGG